MERTLAMEERMTVCNMSIESGARCSYANKVNGLEKSLVNDALHYMKMQANPRQGHPY
jgi:homoaconitase/3-isopropylmalate dehydratase large subunit